LRWNYGVATPFMASAWEDHGQQVIVPVWPGWLRLPLAFGTASRLYEIALMAAAFVLGSGDGFTPAIIGRLALIDAAWLGGLVFVHAVLAAWVQPRRGATSRLAQAS
jgi:hypothetical protein